MDFYPPWPKTTPIWGCQCLYLLLLLCLAQHLVLWMFIFMLIFFSVKLLLKTQEQPKPIFSDLLAPYSNPVPHIKNAIVELGEKATKIFNRLGHLPYKERLHCLGVFHLKWRHLQGGGGHNWHDTYNIMPEMNLAGGGEGNLFSLWCNTSIIWETSTKVNWQESQNRQKEIFIYIYYIFIIIIIII